MCINWTKQLNWGCYFVSGVKTDMSYIAVNEVKSTTIKTGKGGASPCNPNIRVTLFSRGLWSKLNLNQRVRWLVEDSVGWDHWARGGTFCECWLAFFFLQRDSESFAQHQAMITSILIPFSPYLPRQKIDDGTIILLFIADHVWPWSAMVWPWCMTLVCYQLLTMVHGTWLQNKCFLLN